MSDLISRQDAVDALFELYEYQRYIDPSEPADRVRQGIYLAEKKIEQLPPAQQWILVSERLPESEYADTYLVSLECLGIVAVIYELIVCNSDTRFCTGLVLAVIGFITSSVLFAYAFATPPHKEYQVIIDKNTKFYEVYDKYEIVSRDGYIFTLKDKE